jgi:hypothetical protein
MAVLEVLGQWLDLVMVRMSLLRRHVTFSAGGCRRPTVRYILVALKAFEDAKRTVGCRLLQMASCGLRWLPTSSR